MSKLNFKRGLLANLAGAAKNPGTIYITTDEKAMYFDVSETERIRIGDFIQVATADDLVNYAPYSDTAFYYVIDSNALLKYNSEASEDMHWVQINSKSNYQSNLDQINTTLQSHYLAITTNTDNISANADAISAETSRALEAEAAIEAMIGEKMSATDAMKFKGVLNSPDDVPTTNVHLGDTYKIGTKFSYNGTEFFVGDLMIANNDSEESGEYQGSWSHVSSGYEDDYDAYLDVDTSSKTITLRNGVASTRGNFVFVDNYIEDEGGLKITVTSEDDLAGDRATIDFSMLWGSF